VKGDQEGRVCPSFETSQRCSASDFESPKRKKKKKTNHQETDDQKKKKKEQMMIRSFPRKPSQRMIERPFHERGRHFDVVFETFRLSQSEKKLKSNAGYERGEDVPFVPLKVRKRKSVQSTRPRRTCCV